jgi:predicted  nucleic acid-binding Zn-ribbon protein
MDYSSILWIAGAAVAGALAGATACHWHLSRRFALLRDRIDRAEQARNGAIERSAQAREQIAQLNKAIDELRRSHSARGTGERASRSTADERRTAAERALAAADERNLLLPQRDTPQAFADTEVLKEY